MPRLQEILDQAVADGSVPGAAALIDRSGQLEWATAGLAEVETDRAMRSDSIFRIASISKPITAAATLMLIEDGLLAIEDPIGRWLPELAEPRVLRTPSSPVEDTVAAGRPITVGDLLTFTAGWGLASDSSPPMNQRLFDDLGQGPPRPQQFAAPDQWIATLAGIPLLGQPGEHWLYNTCADVLGVLIARASGRSFGDVLGTRIFEPLGMSDTGFFVPADQRYRFTGLYRDGEDGRELVDPPAGQWSTEPGFTSGAGGLVSTLDDWHTFARMVLNGGEHDGHRLLSEESVTAMTTDQTTAAQRETGKVFLAGQGWGFGGSVDLNREQAWNVPGRYGWVGGTGTAAYIVPSTRSIGVLLTQLEMGSPAPPPLLEQFCTYLASP